jgi:hypothetical protein
MLGSTARCFIRGRLNFANPCATISLLLPAPARTRQPLLHIVGTNIASSPTLLRLLGSVPAGKGTSDGEGRELNGKFEANKCSVSCSCPLGVDLAPGLQQSKPIRIR